MKKLLFLSLTIALLSFTSQAQEMQKMNAEDMVSKQMEKIQPALDLDNLEAILVKNILTKYTKERMELRGQNLDKEILMDKFKDISERQKTELSTILSEEQLEKFNKLQEDFKNQRANYPKKSGNQKMGGM